ncbi:MAG TPA: hypothetical protein VM386_04195, partial [Acidimicrobiales bacterium]|nr:hypothetical protein [Acidimicrobiales bacterium]
MDSIGDDGARLVETTAREASALRSLQPAVRVVPVVYYVPAVLAQRRVRAPLVAAGHEAAPASPLTIRVVSEADAAPIAGATVVAFTSLAAGTGAQGTTDSEGRVELRFADDSVVLE